MKLVTLKQKDIRDPECINMMMSFADDTQLILDFENDKIEKHLFSEYAFGLDGATGLSAKGATFIDCRFENCIIANSDLNGVKFLGCEFHDCQFISCDFTDTFFSKCFLNKVHFEKINAMVMCGIRESECLYITTKDLF